MSGTLDARQLRGMADRAVTEGVNLKYVEQMRRALYDAAERIEKLEAEAAPKPTARWRYRLTVEGDDYGRMSSLADLAGLIPDSESEWHVRDDAELHRAGTQE